MKRVILHWSAGKYIPNSCDLNHYHYLVDGDGLLYNGEFHPNDNRDCTDGKYAKHTGGGNTDSIGVAMCAMYGYKNPKQVGDYPITAVQFERTMKLCAELLAQYKLPISPTTLMTHYEFGQQHPQTTSYGKIDITYLPPFPNIHQNDIGAFIRSKVKWYLGHLEN